MDADMDIDMDIDLDVDPEIAQLEAEAMRIDAETSAFQDQNSANNTASDTTESAAAPVHEKVNIQGLDNLTTTDVKNFASEHFSLDHFLRIEWINDTSANIAYETAEAALKALNAFTDSQVGQSYIPPLQERNAKKLSTHPNAELKVRQATTKDVKAPRAHEASRFYLLNPDQDPRERKRLVRGRGGRSRDDRGDYRRRRFDDQEHRRRRDEDVNVAFDVSMYDDDAGSNTRNGSRNISRLGRRGSQSSFTSSSESGRGKRVRFRARKDDDLFAERKSEGRLRDRSASPGPDGDGRMGFEEDENSIRRRIRQRSLTPPSIRREPKNSTQDNSVKELFPSARTPSTLLSPLPGGGKELFPNKSSPAKRTKELFPHKTAISNHRRTDAFDAADETADLFATGMPVPFVDRSGEPRSRDLTDRITKKSLSYGRLNNWPDEPVMDEPATEPDEITVRGSAQAEQVPGFSIRGAAQTAESSSVKELFPLKAGANLGKELFAEKIKGRGGPRRKAEDMFF